jgi:flagellar protein FliO/FliZ
LSLLTAPLVALAAEPAAPTFATSGGVPTLRILCALVLVLAALFAASKLRRGMRITGGRALPPLEVLAQTSVGTRERAVLLRVGHQQVLLGVAAGNVRLLLELPPTRDAQSAPDGAAPAGPPDVDSDRPSFRDLLARSLGR